MDHENRKRAFLIKAVLPTVALAALAGAAWWAFSRQPPAPFDIAAEPRVAIEKGKELRDGWRLAEPAIVNLGPAPEDGVLRLGFFDAGADDGWLKPKSSFEVRVGGALFAEERLDASPGWRDYRIELPNGLSGDCTVAFRPAQEFLLSHCEAFTEEENPRTAFVFLIDALRLDHMSCYGYERETTPNITAFAKDAVRFTQLLPSSSWTRPSVASLLTSMYPEAHGAQDRPDVMRSGMPSLAGRLRAAGFETLGFMSNPNCLPKWGFGDGFARYINVNSYRWWSALDEEVIDSVLEALPYEEGRSRFMYIHTMAPHEPYVPPEPYETMFGDPEALSQPKKNICLYDGEIAYIDAQFARFVNALKEAGLYDQSLIVLLSDHGQGLRTHGKAGHGNSLYEELVRVPLFVKLPDNAHGGETRHGLVEMVDIAPTVMELLGMAPGPGFAGKSFAGVVDGAQEGKPVGYASLRLGKHDMRTAKTPALKYIQNITRSREQWFDLVRDPGERSPMDAPPGEAAQALAAHVAEMEMRGSAGLHILATPSPDRDIEVSGSLGGAGVKLRPAASAPELLELDEESQTFRFRLLRDRARGHSRRACARLRATVAADALPEIRVLVDGKPIAPECVSVGDSAANVPLDGAPVDLTLLAAQPNAYDPFALPQDFGVYVWYVPEVGQVADSELSPEMEEALRGLGYLE